MLESRQVTLSFPEFSGATRILVFCNLGAYFALLFFNLILPSTAAWLFDHLALQPNIFLHGFLGHLWQPLTYSFIHPPSSLIGTLMELLSIWILLGILEGYRGANWVAGLYASAVIGTAISAASIITLSRLFGYSIVEPAPIFGCMGGIFGLSMAIGLLYGDLEFRFMLILNVKARYLAAIYALFAIALLFFHEQRLYAFAQIGGALFGLAYIEIAPRRGLTFAFSESLYAIRNRFYRWKRHRAARKFEVYMRKQGRTVRLDGQGRQIDDDHDDKKRWN